jgi:hypothetical protein
MNTAAIEEKPDEISDISAGTDGGEVPANATPAPEPTVDDILSEYDQATALQPTPDPAQTEQNIDQILQEWGLDSQTQDNAQLLEAQSRNGQLQAEVNALKRAEYERQEQQAFDKYAGEIQSRLPKHLPDDYAKASMLSAAAQDPNLLAAWRYRNVDRNAAEAEFNRLEALHRQISLAPDDPKKTETLRELEKRGWQLGLALNARDILRRAERDLIRRAEEHKAIDVDASLDRAMIAQAIKEGGAGRAAPPQPEVRLGHLTTQEYRRHIKENFGFDSGI